jgi:two-component system sensor histidine kinase BaeS
VGRRAFAIRSTGDGRVLLAAIDRGGAIERRERIGLLLALLVGGTATMVWALWAGGAYARRLARVAGVARRVAGGDFSARGALRGRDELAGLGRDVDRMAARLGALERARQEFVAKISHDLRTPLTIIKGYAYTLERRAGGADDRRRLEAIGRESDRLATLVDDLLTLSQAGAGALRVTLAPLDVDALLGEVEERVRPFADERGVALSVSQSATRPAHGDRRRLAQVLTNLATNAIRHTPAGGTVVMGAADAPDGDAVELTCADTGSGIDPAAVPQLLRAFEHGDGPGSGSGLGLAIVAELVQAHGAALEFEAAPAGGTIARVVLPAAPDLVAAVPS